MNNKESFNHLFSPQAQDAFWGAMDPDTRACFDLFEQKETFTYQYGELPELFMNMANALPDVAVLPVDSRSQSLLISMIPLLASMPFRQCVFSVHWLNDQAKESPIGWGTLCYLEALNIVNNDEGNPNHDMARVIVERITAVMRVRKAMGLFAQWPLKTGN